MRHLEGTSTLFDSVHLYLAGETAALVLAAVEELKVEEAAEARCKVSMGLHNRCQPLLD